MYYTHLEALLAHMSVFFRRPTFSVMFCRSGPTNLCFSQIHNKNKMTESKLAKTHSVKSHPLYFFPRKPMSNKVKVTIHPKVYLRKQQEGKARQKCVRGRCGPTILDVDTDPKSEKSQMCWWRSNYLQVHFTYANAVGAAPYKFDDGNSIKWQLKGVYFFINSLAMVQNSLIAWESIQKAVEINSSTQIGWYIQIAKEIAYAILGISHTISIWKSADKYEKIFKIFGCSSYTSAAATHDFKKPALFALVVSICGLTRALSQSLVGITSGVEVMLIGHCGRIIGKVVKDWDAPENIDFPCGALGVLGFMASFAGGIVQQAALTGSVLAATTLLSACKEFKYKKETPQGLLEVGTGNNANNNVPHGLQIGKRYAELKKISKAVNHAFSPILNLLLLANLFMFASLINYIFNGDIGKGKRGWMLFDAVLACLFLYLANAIGNTGERFREWLKEDRNRIQVGMSQLDVLQEETSSQSIGIGRGAFFISDGFLLGYVGAIVAYFFGIVETRPAIKTDLIEPGYGNLTALNSPCEQLLQLLLSRNFSVQG